MATTPNGRRESNTNATRKVLIEEEDYADYMPKYTGIQDPIVANMWIVKMEQLFDAIKCAEGDKLVYAVSVLRSGAKTWWDKIKDTSGPTEMTWSLFKDVFKQEFSPFRMEMKLVENLVTIKMGRNESVREYTSRFEELWWFYACCLTQEKRLIYMYVKGLPSYIKDLITDKDLVSLEKIMAAALLIDKEYKRRLEGMNAVNKKMGRVRKQ